MLRSIVINREFGSGGREIGATVAERGGMELYDTRILQEAAARRGFAPDLLADFDERVVGGPLFDLSIISVTDPETFSLPYRLYAAIAEVIAEAARMRPSVFIGRCADQVLRDAGLPFLSVFVYSTDAAARTARAVQLDGVAPAEAERYVARKDRSRARYQQFFTGTRFGDLREYDLCLNSARLGYGTCADLVLAAAGAATGTR